MIIVVNDNNSTWKFDSQKDKEEEILGFFEKLQKEERTFEKLELIFKEETKLDDINNLFNYGEGEKRVEKQILTLKPIR